MSTASTPGREPGRDSRNDHAVRSETGGTAGDAPARGRHSAGLFDIRIIIGALLFIYGLLLLAAGLFGDPALEKTGDLNANLMAALPLLVIGVLFVIWARTRPILVPEQPTTGTDDAGARHH